MADHPPLRLTRWVYLRVLGLTALCAFASLYVQMAGLFGSGGILPAADFMASVRAYADEQGWNALQRFAALPTLAWLSASDAALETLALGGIAAALLLLVDVAPGAMIALLWLLYLSLVSVGGIFFQYQWDALLLEALFVSLFLAPWRLAPRLSGDAEPPAAGVWLVRLLLFKLMFLSGAVKLQAHDDTWTSLSALDVHFFTQPLPTWTAYYAHLAPHWVHAGAVLTTLTVELGLPWLVFAPRPGRIAFGAGTMLLMLGIGATGNYGFFNLLTFALAVMCLDDRVLVRLAPRALRAHTPDPDAPGRVSPAWLRRALWGAAALVLLLSALAMLHRLDRQATFGGTALAFVQPFGSINSYGLFQDMTLDRPEIIVEGSRDGTRWQAYEFRYKPGALDARPRFTGPHMPRLDWQMWFAALRGCRPGGWFPRFVERLLTGAPDVRALLARDPFGDSPPRMIRTTIWDYRFADPGGRDWWKRSDPRPYCPVFERRP